MFVDSTLLADFVVMTPGTNKRSAMDFYDLMFNQSRPRDAIDRYAGDEYIQHNPPHEALTCGP